jgi:ribosomal protein S27AE
MKKKECFKCRRSLPLSEFYKHSQMADGLLGKCKDCTRKDVRDRYEREFEKIKEYEKTRASLPHRIALRKSYQQTARGQSAMKRARKRYKESEHGKVVITRASNRYNSSENKKSITKKYRKNNPEKYKAHNQVTISLRNGTLIQQPCEQCGAKRTHAHHDDYTKPLKVRWLCPICHKQEHGEVTNEENT